MKILYRTPENDTSGVPKPLAATEKKSPRTSELALLQAEIANGMYKKPLDAIVKQYHGLRGRPAFLKIYPRSLDGEEGTGPAGFHALWPGRTTPAQTAQQSHPAND